MIDNKLREKILPNLIMNLEKGEELFINDMFSECYLVIENGKELIAVKPPLSRERRPNQILMALEFLAINGAFYAVDDWNYIRQIGQLL